MKKLRKVVVLLLGLGTLFLSCDGEEQESGSNKTSEEEKGYAYVDLGLPSGTLWATYNVGASSPMEYGGYYAWGETETKSDYTWDNYKWCSSIRDDGSPILSKYCNDDYWGTNDGKRVLDSSDDIAQVSWGGKWHIPTIDEWKELLENSIGEESFQDGTRGIKFTSSNGKYIFLPHSGEKYYNSSEDVGAGGHYWSSMTSKNRQPVDAVYLYVKGNDIMLSVSPRMIGGSVRPVFHP